MESETSVELIRRAQDGDALALDRVLARQRPRLRRWAGGRLPHYAREQADTEDLVQDAMIGAVKHVATFEPRDAWGLQAYLRRSVNNRIRDELRRVEARPRRDPLLETVASHEASPLEVIAGREIRGSYAAALATLDDVERAAVAARLDLGCSYREVAALIDKPTADAARMIVARALAKLASRMS